MTTMLCGQDSAMTVGCDKCPSSECERNPEHKLLGKPYCPKCKRVVEADRKHTCVVCGTGTEPYGL